MLNLKFHMRKHKNHHHIFYPAWRLSRQVAAEVLMQRLSLRASLAQGQAFSGLAPLRVMIEACQDLQSTIPHDYVYGLVGLATDGDKIPIDYSKSISEVYLDTLFVTQHTLNLILWTRMLLDHLDLLYRFEIVAKAVEIRAEQGKRWHVPCSGTSRSYVLDASHAWAEKMQFQGGPNWSQRVSVVKLPSWIDAWARQHGPKHPIRKPNELPYMDELWDAPGLQWTVQSKFAINKMQYTEPLDVNSGGAEFPPEIQVAVKASPTSHVDHISDFDNRKQTGQSLRSRFILGALGEIGIASESARAGDLIAQLSNSSIFGSRPVYLLAGWTGDCFEIVARSFLLHNYNEVFTDSNVDQGDRWPKKEMLLYLDIRTLHRLAMRTTYGAA
jgi:hypothetical protein